MKKTRANILIVDDDSHILFSLQTLLERYFTGIFTEKSPEYIPSAMNTRDFDVIMLDMNYVRGETSGEEGIEWIRKILEIDPEISIVPITAYGGVEMAVEALRTGAVDFILKPWQNEKVVSTVTAACNYTRTKRNVHILKEQKAIINRTTSRTSLEFIGSSERMKEVTEKIRKVAETDASVLILGENGTGKGMAARAIHDLSLRREENFIHTDLGSLSNSLFESELFGYMKGAFTDAKENRIGRFEAADKGTLFLDEIGNIPTELQSKLLSVLESGKVYRLGSTRAVETDIRLITATNQDINGMVSEGLFRSDLYYRINTVEITMPALRERKEDIGPIAEHYLKKFSARYNKRIKPLGDRIIKMLETYEWPGNIRELQHSVERAVILSEGNELTAGDFRLKESTGSLPGPAQESFNLEELEKWAILNCLDKHKGHITRTAAELGLTRGALYRRMEKYEIS